MTTTEKIASLLTQRPHTARELLRALGLGREDVYVALVGMEARGEAVLRPVTDGKPKVWQLGGVVPTMTVDAAWSRHPRAREAFARRSLPACDRCAVRFDETLEEAASAYGFDLVQLLDELNALLDAPRRTPQPR